MAWNIHVGMSAPGLGIVLDKQQPNPVYQEGQRYSGHNGQVCLIARSTRRFRRATFCVALWVYGEDEPRKPDFFMVNFDEAARDWNDIRASM